MKRLGILRSGLTLALMLVLGGFSTAEAEVDSEAEAARALTAAQVVARHLEALGGAEALAAIDTVVMKGIYEFNGEERALTILRKRPNLVLIEIDIDGEPFIEAFDGETAWSFFHQQTPEPAAMDEPRGALFREEWSDFDGALVAASKRQVSVELNGHQSIDGTDCWDVKVAFPSGRSQTWYLDAKSFSLVRKITVQVHPRRGEVPRTWFYEQHESFAGVSFPTYIEREDRQFVRALRIESVETNVDLPKSRFTMASVEAAETSAE